MFEKNNLINKIMNLIAENLQILKAADGDEVTGYCTTSPYDTFQF